MEDLNISVLVIIPNDLSFQVSLNEPSSFYVYAMLQDMPRQRIAWSVFSCSRHLALQGAELVIMGKIRVYSRNHDIYLEPKKSFINGCFKWMIPNLYMEDGCSTKHPLIKEWLFGVPGNRYMGCLRQLVGAISRKQLLHGPRVVPNLALEMGEFDSFLGCKYIYIWYPPPRKSAFFMGKGGTIYIYISMFWKFWFCFGRRGVWL